MITRIVEALDKRDPRIDLGMIKAKDLEARTAKDEIFGEALGVMEWLGLDEPVTRAMSAMATHPLERRAILDGMAEAVRTGNVNEYMAWMEQLDLQGRLAGHEAARQIRERKIEELQALSLEAKRNLLRDLLSAGVNIDQAERVEALSRLYPLMELDPGFEQRDQGIRLKVVNRIREELRGDMRRWHRLTDEERQSALARAAAIHAEEFSMSHRTPKITLSDTKSGSGVRDYGAYDRLEGEIKVNHRHRGWSDLDQALDTAIHEDTHNYQEWLGTKLTDQSIKPGHPDYLQASLFALNDGLAYVDGVNFPIYKSQPMERHAWLAGGEVRNLWLAEAQAEAQAVLNELRLGGLERYRYWEQLEDAVTGKNTTSIFRDIDDAKKFLEDERKAKEDEALRQRYIDELRIIQAHPKIQSEAYKIDTLVTLTLRYRISTEELQQEVEAWRAKTTAEST
ncbi:hypothetical protein [Nonomuraea sp. B19D2]|uniref:hypothetical protein n=1 Tax=Nonomuraea sp. B19D2 TaxID=3159561 RepID=UPI0032DA2250